MIALALAQRQGRLAASDTASTDCPPCNATSTGDKAKAVALMFVMGVVFGVPIGAIWERSEQGYGR